MVNIKDKIMSKTQTKFEQPKVRIIVDIIGWFLFIQGFIMAQNSLIWVLRDDDTDKWFLRAAMSMICWGFSGIILKK